MAVFQMGNQSLPSVMCNLCHFELTSSYLNHTNLLLHLTHRYLQQFQDLYTEEGRKSVKICTYIPGQQQVALAAAAANQHSSQSQSNTTQTSTIPAIPASSNPNIQEQKQTKLAIPMPTGSNTVTVLQNNNLAMASHATLPGSTTVTQVPVVQNLSSVRTYGQKLAMFQQRGTVVGSVSSGTGVPLSAATKISTAGWSD